MLQCFTTLLGVKQLKQKQAGKVVTPMAELHRHQGDNLPHRVFV